MGQTRSERGEHRCRPAKLHYRGASSVQPAFTAYDVQLCRGAYCADRRRRANAGGRLWRRGSAAAAGPARRGLHARQGLHAQIRLRPVQTYFSASARISINPSAKNSRTIPPITATGTDFGSRVASNPAEIGITATTAPKATHFTPRPPSASGVNTLATVRVKGSKPQGEGPYIRR